MPGLNPDDPSNPDRPRRRARGGKRAQRARRAADSANPRQTVTLHPDYNLIADSGDLAAYHDAWERFPDDRDTLQMLFADLHEQVYGQPMIRKTYRYDDQAGVENIDSFDDFARLHIQDQGVALHSAYFLLRGLDDENDDPDEGVYERYELVNRAKLLADLAALRAADSDALCDVGVDLGELVAHELPICSDCANGLVRTLNGWDGHDPGCGRLGMAPDDTVLID